MNGKKIGIVVFFLLVSLLSYSNEIVKLATLDWEPYIGQNLKENGYVAEIVKTSFLRSGYEVKYDYLPWARVISSAEGESYDGYFPEYYSEEVDKKFVFSEKFPGGPLGFFRKKGSKIIYKAMSELKGLRIGTVRGYVNTVEFDTAEYLTKEEAVDDVTNIRKLLKGRIDLMVADKFVGLYLLQKDMPNEMADSIEFVEPPLELKDLYVCFGKKSPRAQELKKAFDNGLNEMRKDGTLDKIMKKHGF